MTSTVAPRLSVHLFVSPWATVLLFQLSQADVGIGARYHSPYFPSACYGNDASRYPPTNLFAAAGEGIWDNGAACGRRYMVRCVSAAVPSTCVPGQTIQIKIVDRALTSVSRPSSNGATIVLSTPAFAIVADSSATSIIMEFKQSPDELDEPLQTNDLQQFEEAGHTPSQINAFSRVIDRILMD